MKHIGRLLLVLPLFVAVAVGCTAKNPNAPGTITGSITYKGETVTPGLMTFYTDAGAYPAIIGTDGTYTVAQIPKGEATVTLETESLNPNKKTPQYGGKKGGGMGPMPEYATKNTAKYVKIPAKYAKQETSTIKVTITGGKQTENIDLTD